MSRGVALTGWGGALPPAVVTNADIEARLETTDRWITERTGIRERRIGGTSGGLATEAGQQALGSAGVDPATVDLLVLATTTPDQTMPATAATVHDALGLSGGAFDLNAACAGFVYALHVAHSSVASGNSARALVVGVDIMSGIVDEDDRSTAVLFGDGAGAVVVEATEGEDRVLGWDLGVDGSARDLLSAPVGGKITMEGKEVYRRAVRITVESARAALERAKCTVDDVALFIPHQANLRIIEAVSERLGLPIDRTAAMVDRTGNTSAASIPLALAEAAVSGRIRPGDTVLMTGFGAGMAWASGVLRWGA